MNFKFNSNKTFVPHLMILRIYFQFDTYNFERLSKTFRRETVKYNHH